MCVFTVGVCVMLRYIFKLLCMYRCYTCVCIVLSLFIVFICVRFCCVISLFSYFCSAPSRTVLIILGELCCMFNVVAIIHIA